MLPINVSINTQVALSTAEGSFCGRLEVSMTTWGPLGRKVGRSERDCGFDPEARWLLWGEMPPLRSRILAVRPLPPTSPRVDGREHPQNTRIQGCQCRGLHITCARVQCEAGGAALKGGGRAVSGRRCRYPTRKAGAGASLAAASRGG